MFSQFCQFLHTIYQGLLQGSGAIDQFDQEGGRQVYPIPVGLRPASSFRSVKKYVHNGLNPTSLRLWASVGNASRASFRFCACALEFVEDTIAWAEDLCSAGSFSSSFVLHYRIQQRSCEPLERPESIRLVFPHLIQHSNSYLSFLFTSLIGTLSTLESIAATIDSPIGNISSSYWRPTELRASHAQH